MANHQLRWAILGCGKIAQKFASDLALCQGSKLVACASRDKEKSMAFAESYTDVKEYDNYQDLVNDPEVDIIYIATPHTFHFEQTMLCLHHGKHVLCEKPIGINAHQMEQMSKLALEKKLFLMEAMWTAFLPMMDGLKTVIDHDTIGELKHIHADFGFLSAFDPKSRLYDLVLGGGALLDIGIYPIFIATVLMGKPSSIKSDMTKSPAGSDISTNIIFRYENGATASLLATVDTNTPIACEIYGTKGKIIIPSRFHEQSRFEVTIFDGETATHSFERIGLGYAHQVQHVEQCLRDGLIQSPIMSHQFSIDILELMDTVRQQNGLSYPGEL